MKINKLTATFGMLQNESLSFHDGLNIINAPNESGKSTWCAFTRAMLYGVDSSERRRSGYMPDMLRYAPRSGAPMEGVMELTADNCDITLTRRTKAKSAPMRDFTATYTGSNVRVEGMTGTNAGEMITGVSRDLFCRSAFIAQGSVAPSDSPELEKKISSIVSSGDEDSSYADADARLKSWQHKRRYNRKGLLPELEADIYAAEQKLSDMSGAADEIKKLEEELDSVKVKCRELEKSVTDSRKTQRKQTLDKLRAVRSSTSRSSEAHDLAMAELAERKEALSRKTGGRSLEELQTELDENLERFERSTAKTDGKRVVSIIPTLVLFALAVICVSIYAAKQLVPLAVFAGLLTVGAIFLLTKYLSAHRVIVDEREIQRQILKKYRVSDIDALRRCLDALRMEFDELSEYEIRERRTRTDYENARLIQEELESEALQELDFSSGSSSAAKYTAALTAEMRKAETLSNRIAAIKSRLAAIGDPLVIASELLSMEQERDELEAEYAAITLAIDTLRDADSEIQSQLSPALGKAAAEYMSFLTDGRCAEMLSDRDFSALKKSDGDAPIAGAEELMYLSVRLAVCNLTMPQEESCPLIIDDALTNLDDEHFEKAIELLKLISRERQVILFNCRGSKDGLICQ